MIERPVHRIDPILPVNAMKTYAVVRPVKTHTKPATCAEVDCPNRINGWVTKLDVSADVHREAANWIRLHSGRRWTVEQAGTLVSFTFPAGQECFTAHRVWLDKQEVFLKRGGDWRAVTSPAIKMRPADWVDDFANHQIGIADVRKRG